MEMTVGLVCFGAAATAASLWGSRRKRPFGRVSLVPWNGIMFVGVTALITGVVHLATLMRGGA